MVDKHCTQNPAFYISTSSRSSTLRPQNQLSAAQEQHKGLCSFLKGASVTLHTILLGVGGTICNSYTLEPFQELGLDSQRAKELASKLHVHPVNYAAKLVHTRRTFSSIIINCHQKPFQVKPATLLIPVNLFLI